jgi:hypothetical protein
MITQIGGPVSVSRRALLSWPFVASLSRASPAAQASVERELIARVDCDDGLAAPVTLGIARVIVRPGAVVEATTPGGVRVFVVESGTLAIGATSPSPTTISSTVLATTVALPDQNGDTLLSTGTATSFVSRRVVSVGNPGKRPAVALDVAVFHQEPRTLLRAFTTKTGLSFQLLANASADRCPEGKLRVALERLRIAAGNEVPADLRDGLTLVYVDAGTLSLRRLQGEVLAGRPAAVAPYSVPGALQPVPAGEQRDLTAGGTLFLPRGGRVEAVNQRDHAIALLVLTLREAA